MLLEQHLVLVMPLCLGSPIRTSAPTEQRCRKVAGCCFGGLNPDQGEGEESWGG